jgi:hypothetical protein
MHIQHLLIGGNSFTQDSIGGVPPDVKKNSNGGCSFIFQGQTEKISEPRSWASLLAKELEVQSFVNTAASSHGNILIAQSLRWMLDNYNYNPANTLVLFNVSMPTRLDIPCEFENPNASHYVPWSRDLIPYTYLRRDSKTYQTIEKQVGLDIVPDLSWAELDFLSCYLEHRGYNYYFLLTENYLDDEKFCRWAVNRRSRLIEITPGTGMCEFAAITGHNTENGYHPDAQGREIIKNQVKQFLLDQYNKID